MRKMSVVVTTYNQSYCSIVQTLNSIVNQSFENFEIIIADDCSEENQEDAARKYFSEVGFNDYRIIINKKNVGTVKNILGAARAADGEFVKFIGAGDLLYSSDTLLKMYDFCISNQISLAFGKLKTFSRAENGVTIQPFHAPSNPELYVGIQNKKEILKQMLIKGDWLPGGGLFFRREYLVKYLAKLANDYHVKYCEDLVSPLVALNDRIDYLDEYVLWYEWGVGISNDGTVSAKRKMYEDHSNFFSRLKQQYAESPIVSKAYSKFKLKRFVMLRTPLSNMLSWFKSKKYLEKPNSQRNKNTLDQEFLSKNLGLL